MSDLLSKYFENISIHKKNKKNQFLTLSQDLSEYGLYLSNNNILSFTPKKSFSSLRKINSINDIYTNINLPYFSEKTKYDNTSNLPKKDNNIQIVVNEKPSSNNENNELKFRNNIIIKNNSLYSNYKSNLNFLKKNRFLKNKSNINTNIFNIKNSLYKENINNLKKKSEAKKENDEKTINLILDNLQRKIKYNRNINKKKSFQFSYTINNSPKQPEINPMKYIKMNLSENPHSPDKFKSYNIQVKLIGNEKNRNLLLDGINFYNMNYVKYKSIKPTMIFNTKYEKEQNKKINEMFHDKKRPKLIFNTQYNNNKKSKKLLKNIKTFSFENKHKEAKNKRIDNLNYRLNLISKNDIVSLNNYIEKNRKYLSFDKKINLMLLRAKKTSKYINKRTEEYSKINKIIFESI